MAKQRRRFGLSGMKRKTNGLQPKQPLDTGMMAKQPLVPQGTFVSTLGAGFENLKRRRPMPMKIGRMRGRTMLGQGF